MITKIESSSAVQELQTRLREVDERRRFLREEKGRLEAIPVFRRNPRWKAEMASVTARQRDAAQEKNRIGKALYESLKEKRIEEEREERKRVLSEISPTETDPEVLLQSAAHLLSQIPPDRLPANLSYNVTALSRAISSYLKSLWEDT